MANKELSNFLATDKVPESLFGIPIVASPEQYTQSDIEFFKSHPRAGGFYELGEDDETTEQAAEKVESPNPLPVIPVQVKKQDIAFMESPGRREDGTYKGEGWWSFKLSDGRDVTENSIGVNIDGQEILIPTVVPTLSPDQRGRLKESLEKNQNLPEDIVTTAVAFAKSRLGANKSPFKNDGLPTKDYVAMRGSKLRQFAHRKGHESLKGMYWKWDAKDPEVRTVWLLPGKDSEGNRDVFGYRTFLDSDGVEYTLGNTTKSDSPITLATWLDGARKTDEKLVEVTLRNLDKWGVTSRQGREILTPLVWDISFPAGETSARNRLFTHRKSPEFNDRRDSLLSRGVSEEQATILAFLDQAAYYQGNKNRSRARLEGLLERLATAGGVYAPFVNLYRDGYGKHQVKKTNTLDNQLFSRLENGVKAIRGSLNKYKLPLEVEGLVDEDGYSVYDPEIYKSIPSFRKVHGLTKKKWGDLNGNISDQKVEKYQRLRVRPGKPRTK